MILSGVHDYVRHGNIPLELHNPAELRGPSFNYCTFYKFSILPAPPNTYILRSASAQCTVYRNQQYLRMSYTGDVSSADLTHNSRLMSLHTRTGPGEYFCSESSHRASSTIFGEVRHQGAPHQRPSHKLSKTVTRILTCLLPNSLQVSKITARSLWVALSIGIPLMVAIWQGAPAMVRAMGASPQVAGYAVTYLRCRAVASPAALAIYVAIGTFRGFRDTTYADGTHGLLHVLPNGMYYMMYYTI